MILIESCHLFSAETLANTASTRIFIYVYSYLYNYKNMEKYKRIYTLWFQQVHKLGGAE